MPRRFHKASITTTGPSPSVRISLISPGKASLDLPPIMDPIFGYEVVNVEAQNRDASSLLNWMRRIIEVRRAHRVFGRGSLVFLHPGNRKILAYVREEADRESSEAVLCVANLARGAQSVELDLARFRGRVPIEMLGQTAFPPIGELPYLLTLPRHGFYWFLLSAHSEAPAWHEEGLPALRLATLVQGRGRRATEGPRSSSDPLARCTDCGAGFSVATNDWSPHRSGIVRLSRPPRLGEPALWSGTAKV